MQRKILSFILCALMAAGMTSCSSNENNKNKDYEKNDRKLSVVTTIFPQYDFVRQIAGDEVKLTMLLKPGAESHTYDPAPKDRVLIQECDLFIYNGGEGDVWADNILDSVDKPINTVAMMDCVETVEEETVEGMQAEKESDDEPEFDEHVWTSPENAKMIVSVISEKLCEADPEHADEFRTNTEKYIAELEELDGRIEQIVSEAPNKTIVFGDRFPFRYFADAYGLDYYAAFPGCSSDTEPSASTIAFLIDKVRNEQIPVIFAIEFSNRKIADTISESTGAEILEFHSCHNISSDDMKNGETYISIMNRNADNLNKALLINK